MSEMALGADFVPVAAVEVELVAVGLAQGAVAEVGVQRVAVVGRLLGAARPLDRAEPSGDPGTGRGPAGDRWPVGGTRPGALGAGRVSGANQYSVRPLALVSTVTPPMVAVFKVTPAPTAAAGGPPALAAATPSRTKAAAETATTAATTIDIAACIRVNP